MAIASPSKEKTGLESLPSSLLESKPGSDSGSETSSVGISGTGDPSDRNDQPDSSVNKRKEFESQSPPSLKSEEYRLLFRLPPDEVLVQDFNCALQESILLQGHMYLFVRHICFYSNIFGFETKKAIPFNEVTCVRKAKTAAIFPNAIEIVSGEKKNFFASFLSRDEAYRLIVDGWSQYCKGANTIIDHQDLKSEIISPANEHVMLENTTNFQEPPDLISMDRNKDAHLSGENKPLLIGEDYISVSRNLIEAQENGEEDAEQVLNAECLSSGEPLRWKLEDADAPTVPDCYTKVAESKFPIQVEEFFNHFFSDDGVNFIEMFHQRCGDKDFRCSSWYEHEQFGYARDLSFQHPIKIYFGAKFGHCREVQKFRVYRNSHLVIETSQEITDVPYGDYFRVEGLWTVERDDDETSNSCILRVYVYVAFSKKTMWKGKIEQSTIEECREAYATWLDNAFEFLKQKNLAKLEGAAPASNTIQNDDVQLEGLENNGSSERLLHDTRNLQGTAQVSPDCKDVNPHLENLGQRDFREATSITSLLREPLASLCLYLKSQNHFPLVLVIASVSIILLMQLSIIVLLTRTPQVHLVSQMDYMNGIGSNGGERAEVVAWLEKRVHHLKDDMLMVETRLEKMRHEHALLKAHLKGLEQLNNAR